MRHEKNTSWTDFLIELLKIHFLFLIIMSLFRLISLFLYGNKSILWDLKTDLLKSLFLGFRFDLSTLCYFSIPINLFFLIYFLLQRSNYFHCEKTSLPLLFTQYYYLFTFTLISLILAVDLGYYSYFQDHLNILFFGFFEDDTLALIRTFWKNYPIPLIVLFSLLYVYLLYLFINKHIFKNSFVRSPNNWTPFFISFLILLILALGARGSLSLFPLHGADTVVSTNPFINHLSYNGVHALFRAIKIKRLQKTQWNHNAAYYSYKEINTALADYLDIPLEKVSSNNPTPLKLLEKTSPSNPWAEKNKPHVIVILMESFGSYWLKFQSPEFNLMRDLEKHFKEDYYFTHFLPSSNGTIASLSSLMIAAPHPPEKPFLTEGPYLQVPFRTAPARIFKQAGYRTRYVYGGNPAWRDVNKFAPIQGFDQIEGEVDVENLLGPRKEKQDWGIYDEDFFNYIYKTLESAQEPQMILGLTTTNHPPYIVPKNYQAASLIPPQELLQRLNGQEDLAKERFKVFQYANQKLAEFIDKIKASPLGKKTIIAITGDHNFFIINYSEKELLDKWKVPLYVYLPHEIRKPVDLKTFGSHMDIFPTLIPMALSKVSYSALGQDLWDSQAYHFVPFFDRLVLGKDGALYALKDNQTHYYDWENEKKESLVSGLANEAKIKLKKKYEALMSLLDYYFMIEKTEHNKHLKKDLKE